MLHFKASRVALFGAAASVLIVAAPASATIITVTFTGTVAYDGVYNPNPYGLFGDPAVGDKIVTRLVFDTAKADYFYSDAQASSFDAGSSAGGGPPVGFVISASITIGSTTTWIVAANSGHLYFKKDGTVLSAGAGHFDEPIVVDPPPSPPWANYTSINGFYNSDNMIMSSTGINYAGGGPNSYGSVFGPVESVTVTAPEPSTWAMLLLGFAGLGFAGYRRATVAVAA